MIYVAALSGLSTIALQKDPCSEFRYSSPRDNCGLLGALPPPAGLHRASDARWRLRGPRAMPRMLGGVSILKPKELGGITAYDMNSGDKKWWIPNGGIHAGHGARDPLFAGVTLPPRAAGGQAQIITTKSLLIYGTGRSGGVPNAQAAAVRGGQGDRATGRRGEDSVAHDGGADDVHAQGQAVHRVRDGRRFEHVAGGDAAAVAAAIVSRHLRSVQRTR